MNDEKTMVEMKEILEMVGYQYSQAGANGHRLRGPRSGNLKKTIDIIMSR